MRPKVGNLFKFINNCLGYLTGDKLLIEVAKRLQFCLPTDAILARLDGDTFIILQKNITDINIVISLAETIKDNFEKPFYLKENPFLISFSIGISFGNQYTQAEDILRDADIAMFKAKRKGKGHFQIFDSTMREETLKSLHIENELRQAIKTKSLSVFYQPIYDLKTRNIVSFEALVRWIHPQMGFISPDDFIPLAEDNGLIIPLGLFVLHTACLQLVLWQNANLVHSQTTMSVNVSSKQFAQLELINNIDLILEETQLNPQYLKLEITETAIMDNPEKTALILKELTNKQIKVSIDDFGTGYSSLSYLYRFPVNSLKIDRSFVDNSEIDQEKFKIIETIISLAHKLNLTVIAEGIETIDQEKLLTNLDCNFGQGYLFSKAMSSENMELLLTSIQAN